MTHSRLLLLTLAAVVVVAGGWLAWVWQLRAVNVIVVNASGRPAQLSWQPGPFADEVSQSIGGCESKSVDLRAGQTWHLRAAGLETGSAAVEIPLTASRVAVEIWLAPDGSSRLVLPYPVDGPMDAPEPSGCPR